MSTIEDRALDWFGGGRVGLSSKSIAMHMLGRRSEGNYPSDPDDLSRCLRLLRLIPEWVPRMPEMAKYGGAWIGLVEQWDAITASMEEEVGWDWSKGKSAEKTYRMMKLAQADGYRRDPKYDCTFRPDGTLSGWSRK